MTDVATGAPNQNGHRDERPLAGLVAVSLAQNLPGPLALEMLAAEGIGAIKVEPPSGDLLGHAAPGWYAELGQGIDTRQIDLRSEAGKAELDRLLAGADLLITSQRPSALSRLGVTVESLARVNPRLCWVEIVGDTGKGKLWRITAPITDRADAATPATSPIALLQLGAVAIALLLAIPTRRSLADSRRRSRIVGAQKGDAA